MSYSPSSSRYDAMQYRTSGRSGLKLPAISLGLWHNFGHDTEPERSREAEAAHDPLAPPSGYAVAQGSRGEPDARDLRGGDRCDTHALRCPAVRVADGDARREAERRGMVGVRVWFAALESALPRRGNAAGTRARA